MFINFVNFYKCFIWTFSKIFIPLSLILKITKLSKKLALKKFKAENNEIIWESDNKFDKTVKKLSKIRK